MKRLGVVAILLACAPTLAGGFLEKDHATVEAGNRAWNEGRYEDALAAFEAARRELPNDPRVDFDVGTALYKLGRYQEAKEAWMRAAENDKGRGALQQKDYYNIGNALAQLNQKKEAMAAYRKALRMDPSDAQARHNLEMLLRDVPPQKKDQDQGDGGQDGGSDGGQPDGGGNDGGQKGDGGQDGGVDGGAGDGGTSDGGTGDGGVADGGQADGGSSQSEQQGRDGGADAGMDGGSMSGSELEQTDGGTMPELSEQDAEKLLDSMKRNEKNLQLWRFQQQKQRKPNEKDW